MFPTMEELKKMRQALDDLEKDVMLILDTVLSVADQLPNFTRETEYISLKHDKEFPFYDGMTYSSDTKKTYENNDYLTVVNEFVVPYSTCKRAKHKRDSFMVGALARCNNNPELLKTGLAAAVAKKFSFKTPCYNTFMNSVAQLVEYALTWERAKRLLDEFIKKGIENEEPVKPNFKVAGRGVGITEAPRGLLIHDYTYDKAGKCLKANCVIPTNLNTGNMEDDMKAIIPTLVAEGKSPEDIKFILEMLIRAYDPCFSCSVHLIER
jgi:coenzyme F420-reducing hydrogenase alpha subunit